MHTAKLTGIPETSIKSKRACIVSRELIILVYIILDLRNKSMTACETQPAAEKRRRQFIENRFFFRTDPSEAGRKRLPLRSVGHGQDFLAIPLSV
jgi:hypothetical protein